MSASDIVVLKESGYSFRPSYLYKEKNKSWETNVQKYKSNMKENISIHDDTNKRSTFFIKK